MRARLYRPRTTDAASLDALLDSNRQGDVRLDSDRIILVERNLPGPPPSARVVGALVWRPTGFIHELVISDTVTRRLGATALMNYALGDVSGKEHRIAQAIFLVDSTNLPMLRFVRDAGATEQTGTVFTLDL